MNKPVFQNRLDSERPHALISDIEQALQLGQLEYRYLDTNERVLVPNFWYNQPLELRARHFEVLALQLDDLAAGMARKESRLLLPDQMARKEAHYRQQALAYREQAAAFREEDRMQQEKNARDANKKSIQFAIEANANLLALRRRRYAEFALSAA